MSIDEIIQEKINLIESETGNDVRISVNDHINVDALIDWPNWEGMERKQLPCARALKKRKHTHFDISLFLLNYECPAHAKYVACPNNTNY